jgi:hypothetical protein
MTQVVVKRANERDVAKLAYLQQATVTGTGPVLDWDRRDSTMWQAPEGPVSPKSDVYSATMVLAFMVNRGILVG